MKLPLTSNLNVLFVACFAMILFLTPSCESDVEGCTNVNATNYNPDATNDNGTCIIPGCTNANAENYDASATEDNGSCILARDKFLGSYNVNENCQSGTFAYTISITESGTDETAIVINNFGDFGENVRATVSGSSISYNDTQGGITFSGSGEISGNTLTIIYTASAGGQSDSCTKTCLKQ